MASSATVDSSDEDEELKRALELSHQESLYISDSDEDLNRAIALSLEQLAGSALSDLASAAVAIAPPTPVAHNGAAVVVSEDEFDEMCTNDISLKEKLSRSSLGSGGEVCIFDQKAIFLG